MKNFNETQRFTQWWIWVILLLIPSVFIYGIIQQSVFGIPFGNKPVSNTQLALFGLIPLTIIVLFFAVNLQTAITNEGITYKFFPFHWKKRFISWNEISEIYVREYKPISEYGGWGIKFGRKAGKAYNVSGNKGLQLVLKNGKKILLGTKHYDELLSMQTEFNSKLK